MSDSASFWEGDCCDTGQWVRWRWTFTYGLWCERCESKTATREDRWQNGRHTYAGINCPCGHARALTCKVD